jgi:hypothetical protein
MMNELQLRSSVESNTTEKKERPLDFAMAHHNVFFQVNKIRSKSDGGSPNAKRERAENRVLIVLKKERNFMKRKRKPKSFKDSLKLKVFIN